MMDSIFKCISEPQPGNTTVKGSRFTQEPFEVNTNPTSRKILTKNNGKLASKNYFVIGPRLSSMKLSMGQDYDSPRQESNANTFVKFAPEKNSNFYTPKQKMEAHEDSLDDLRAAKTAVNQNEDRFGSAAAL